MISDAQLFSDVGRGDIMILIMREECKVKTVYDTEFHIVSS